MKELLQKLPKVDVLLDFPEIQALIDDHPRRIVIQAIREVLDGYRLRILDGESVDPAELEQRRIVDLVRKRTEDLVRPVFQRVVNGTGIVVHTNLGRSLMAREAMEAVVMGGSHYTNLEFDLATGKRGSRYSHVEGLLCDLTGAEAALVVNNNAAAVLISLETLAIDRQVIVSRGELVEIGGSFRIPDVMARSGAHLVEIGATNKTHLGDYEGAINEDTALILKVHQSNFEIIGFTQQVPAVELTKMAHEKGLPVMEDLGSGCLVDLSKYGIRKEPTVSESVANDIDVVTFSGDKLLGGPQAGIILGRKDIVDRIKKNPINRAMRIDKFTLAALEATLRLYLDEEKAKTGIPTLRMITTSYQDLARKAARLRRKLSPCATNGLTLSLVDGQSQIGGGALPAQNLKSRLLAIRSSRMSVNRLENYFRSRPIPIIGRIENDMFLLDLRTLDDGDFNVIAEAMAGLVSGEEI